MAIENFTSAQFEAALPAGLWKSLGVDMKTRQLLYSVTPYPTSPMFAILVYSSILASGASSKEAGRDSIRAVIVKDGQPWGGKTVRWIDRRPGWNRRLLEALRSLTGQILWLIKCPCPACGSTLVPFTSRKGKEENKGRPFVTCKNPDCKAPAWHWTETEDGQPIKPPNGKPDPAPTDAPTCPKCGSAMRRMTSGKGWRCATQGNAWVDGAWSKCDGAIWDNDRPESTAPVAAKPTPPPRGPGTQAPSYVPGFKCSASALADTIRQCIRIAGDASTEMEMSDALTEIQEALSRLL